MGTRVGLDESSDPALDPTSDDDELVLSDTDDESELVSKDGIDQIISEGQLEIEFLDRQDHK